MLAIQPINISTFVIFLTLMSKLKEIIQKLIDQGFSEEEANKEAYRINKIDEEFERKLLSIKKFQKKENIEKIYSGDKYTIGDVIANIKSTLYKDPPGQERIFDKNFNLNSYINKSIENLKKTSDRLKSNLNKAKIIHPGDQIINEKKFIVGKNYYLKEVKDMEKLQKQYNKNPVRYIEHTVSFSNYDENYLQNEDDNSMNEQEISIYENYKTEKENYIAEDNRERNLEKIFENINKLGEKCRLLLNEYMQKEITNMKDWAIQRDEEYTKLKTNFHRCKEKLIQLINSKTNNNQNLQYN